VNQQDIVALVANRAAEWNWVPLAPGLEVMAWPVMAGDYFVAVSARTASACAVALCRNGWLCSLTTPQVEDWIYERAVLCPAPVVLDPQRFDVASPSAVAKHSCKLRRRLMFARQSALVACGKSWVLCNGLLSRPGHAATYGQFSPNAPFRSATGAYPVWQPLSFAHDLDYWDYSQLLRLVRRRPGTRLPSYDTPLRVTELVRTLIRPPSGLSSAPAVAQTPGGIAKGGTGR
jgi:hypothetical protein